jgi:hypothetical protein
MTENHEIMRWRWLPAVGLVWGLLSGTTVSAAKPKPPQTVVEYYLLLPGEWFSPAVGNSKDRLDLLDPKRDGVVDIRNGYLQTTTTATQELLTVCLFRRPDHSYLVAASANLAPDDGSWAPAIQFYTYRNGRLVDVTHSTLPRHFSGRLGYVLPRHGRTISVITKSGKRVYEMLWVRRKFQVKQVS